MNGENIMVTDDQAYYIGQNITKMFENANYFCETCKEPVHSRGLGQPAYRIPRNKENIESLGIEVIFHHFNLKAVCSHVCANKWPITNIAEKTKLIHEIRTDLDHRPDFESEMRKLFDEVKI